MYKTNGVSPYIGFAYFIRLGLRVGFGYTQFRGYVNHMPDAFTEAFMAVVFIRGSYGGRFHEIYF